MSTTAAPETPVRKRLGKPGPLESAGETHRVWPARAAWLVFLAAAVFILQGTLTADFRERPLVGDQTSYLMQAQSLAFDRDLSYDEGDLDRWRAIEWREEPAGLFFQKTEDGYAFAKPYGYSLYLVPFLRVLDPVGAVAVGNSLLLVALAGITIGILRLRFRGGVVPLVAGAFCFAAYPYLYTYVVHADLFLAVLMGAIVLSFLLHWSTRHPAFAVVAAALGAFALAEKPPFLLLLAPLGLLSLRVEPSWWRRAAYLGTAAVVVLVAFAPYWHYSGGGALNPYGTERYYVTSDPPFGGGTEPEGYQRAPTDATTAISHIATELRADWDARALASGYFFVGRHTGMLAFLPVGLLLAVLSLGAVRRRGTSWAGAAALGLTLYVAFFILLHPTNFFGGGQAIGNRYFVQVSVVLLAIAVAARVPRGLTALAGAAGIALGLTFLAPHHLSPEDAFTELDRTSPAQRLLPFERNVTGANYFRCGHEVCPPGEG